MCSVRGEIRNLLLSLVILSSYIASAQGISGRKCTGEYDPIFFQIYSSQENYKRFITRVNLGFQTPVHLETVHHFTKWSKNLLGTRANVDVRVSFESCTRTKGGALKCEALEAGRRERLIYLIDQSFRLGSETVGVRFTFKDVDPVFGNSEQNRDRLRIVLLQPKDPLWKAMGREKQDGSPQAFAIPSGHFSTPLLPLNYASVVMSEKIDATILVHEVNHALFLASDTTEGEKHKSFLEFNSSSGTQQIHPLEVAAFFWRMGAVPPKWFAYYKSQECFAKKRGARLVAGPQFDFSPKENPRGSRPN